MNSSSKISPLLVLIYLNKNNQTDPNPNPETRNEISEGKTQIFRKFNQAAKKNPKRGQNRRTHYWRLSCTGRAQKPDKKLISSQRKPPPTQA